MDQNLQEKFIIRMLLNGIRKEIIADDRGITIEQIDAIIDRNKDFIDRQKKKKIADSIKENLEKLYKSNVEKETNISIIMKLIELGYVGKEIDYEEFKRLYEEFGSGMNKSEFCLTVLGINGVMLSKCKNNHIKIRILREYIEDKNELSEKNLSDNEIDAERR